MRKLTELEQHHSLTTKQAAKLLGIGYPAYMAFKAGTRQLRPYHEASVRAHMMLPKTQVKKLVEGGGA